MKSIKTKFILFILIFSLGCSDPKEEVEPNISCSGNLKIDGVYETFCESPSVDFKTNLETSEGLYVQFKNVQYSNFSSDNYEMFNIGFANTIPKTQEWESETDFFESLLVLLRPETLHSLDIKELGGFAIELWDKNGVYFSSELGSDNIGVQVEIRRLNLDYGGPITAQVVSTMSATLKSNAPVKVWNIDNTKSHLIEVEHLELLFTF